MLIQTTAIAEDALSAWLNLIMRRWINLILGFWKANPINGHWSVGSYRHAPTFRQDSISPNASKPADSLTSTYNSKAASCLKRQALDVFRYGGCLQSPDPMLLRRFYKVLPVGRAQRHSRALGSTRKFQPQPRLHSMDASTRSSRSPSQGCAHSVLPTSNGEGVPHPTPPRKALGSQM